MSLWTIIFGEPDDWRMVKLHACEYYSQLKPLHPEYNHSDPNANKTDHEYTYYLYENQHGNRKIDVIDTQRGDLDIKDEAKDSFVFRNADYRTIIRPWLDGSYDPDIPSYESIKAKEFKDNLAGRKT